MNKDNAKDYLPLVQALAEGKVVEIQGSDGWKVLSNYDFTSPPKHYRIKPEPKEIWVNRYSDGSESIHYATEDTARIFAGPNKGVIQVRYREVIE